MQRHQANTLPIVKTWRSLLTHRVEKMHRKASHGQIAKRTQADQQVPHGQITKRTQARNPRMRQKLLTP
jgi:hypothetical protein